MLYIRIVPGESSLFLTNLKFGLKTLELYCQTEQIRIWNLPKFTLLEPIFCNSGKSESQICTLCAKLELVFYKNKSFPPESDGNVFFVTCFRSFS